jgi:hypothetical protein
MGLHGLLQGYLYLLFFLPHHDDETELYSENLGVEMIRFGQLLNPK